jgi:hypothetical protein
MAFSFVFGSVIGYGWATLVDYTDLINLRYMSGGVSNETCQMAAQTQFKCTLRRLS